MKIFIKNKLKNKFKKAAKNRCKHKFESDGGPCLKCGKTVTELLEKAK